MDRGVVGDPTDRPPRSALVNQSQLDECWPVSARQADGGTLSRAVSGYDGPT
jgi:hypothetical protein